MAQNENNSQKLENKKDAFSVRLDTVVSGFSLLKFNKIGFYSGAILSILLSIINPLTDITAPMYLYTIFCGIGYIAENR